MPQVPYRPYPEIAPTREATPEVRIATPEDAFGVGVARAVEHLGTVTEHAGSELFQRAVALKQLDNETEAREADAKYMVQAGELHAKFNALQGRERVLGYKQYQKDLDASRVQLRQGLTNDSARKMYDSSSLMTMGRSIFNGAGAAASAQKEWTISTAQSQAALDAKASSDDPTNQRLFDEKRQRIIDNTNLVTVAKGYTPDSPQGQLAVQTATSSQRLQQLTGMARRQPFEAGTMLEKFSKDLTEDDRLRADQIITSNKHALGSAKIAEEAIEWGQATETSPPKTLKQIEDFIRKRAEELDPNDPVLKQKAVQTGYGLYLKDKQAAAQADNENKQVIADAWMKTGAGTVRELMLDPKFAAAYNSLKPTEQNAVQSRINNWNAAKNKPDNDENYNTIWGLSNRDVEKFLNTNIEEYQLSQPQIEKLYKRRKEVMKDASGDPRVNRAIGWMKATNGDEMRALGVFKSNPDNPDPYDHFVGAVQQAIDVWQQEHKSPPQYDDFIKKIAPEILRQRTELGRLGFLGQGPGMFFGGSKVPFFERDMSSDAAKQFAKEYTQQQLIKGEREPPEQEIYRQYLRQLYKDLYKGAPSAPKDQSKPGGPKREEAL